MKEANYLAALLAATITLLPPAAAWAEGCAIVVGGPGGGSSSENYGVDVDLMGSGGGAASSDSYSLHASIGQAVRNVQSSSPNYSADSGMWSALVTVDGEEPVFDPVGCAGQFTIASLADYAAYVASDYGRSGRERYRHLRVIANLTGDTVALVSPCEIRVDQGLSLDGDIVLLDGREGVKIRNHASMSANAICIESDVQSVDIGNNVNVATGTLVVQSRTGSRVGRGFNADASGHVRIGSTNGGIDVGRDLVLRGDEVELDAGGGVVLGSDAYIESQDSIRMSSTSSFHWIILGSDAALTAGEIRLVAAGLSVVGADSNLDASRLIEVRSTGAGPLGLAAVQDGVSLSSGEDMVVSGNRRIYIGPDSLLNTIGNIEVDAFQSSFIYCLISPTAAINYATKSGACAVFLP